MGFEAAKNALQLANICPNDIDLVWLVTNSHSYAYPSAACQICMLDIDDAIFGRRQLARGLSML